MNLEALAGEIIDDLFAGTPGGGSIDKPLFVVDGRIYDAAAMAHLQANYLGLYDGSPDRYIIWKTTELYLAAKQVLRLELSQPTKRPMALVWPGRNGYELIRGYGDEQAINAMLEALPRRPYVPEHRRIYTGLTPDERTTWDQLYHDWIVYVIDNWAEIAPQFEALKPTLVEYIRHGQMDTRDLTRSLAIGEAIGALVDGLVRKVPAQELSILIDRVSEETGDRANTNRWKVITKFTERFENPAWDMMEQTT